jgi:hypothetical protein
MTAEGRTTWPRTPDDAPDSSARVRSLRVVSARSDHRVDGQDATREVKMAFAGRRVRVPRLAFAWPCGCGDAA